MGCYAPMLRQRAGSLPPRPSHLSSTTGQPTVAPSSRQTAMMEAQKKEWAEMQRERARAQAKAKAEKEKAKAESKAAASTAGRASA